VNAGGAAVERTLRDDPEEVSMNLAAPAPRLAARALPLATATLLTATLLGGCASQEFLRSLGQSASSGAMEGVGRGIPGLTEPIKQALRDALLEDETLRRAAGQLGGAAVLGAQERLRSPELAEQLDALVDRLVARAATDGNEALRQLIEARLASPELRAQVDAFVAATIAKLASGGDEAIRQLVQTAGAELRTELRAAMVDSITVATAKLRERLEQDVTPATQMLAQRTAEQLVATLVVGLEGPLQRRLEALGGEMSKALIAGAARGMADPTNMTSAGDLSHLVMFRAMQGARKGMSEGLPDERQVVLIAGIVVLGALLLMCLAGLGIYWWRYQQSAKSLTIVAENINDYELTELKAAIHRSAQDNHVGPWLSTFLM
jgi:hypothetical protein